MFRKSACPFGQVKTKMCLPESPFFKNLLAGALQAMVLMSVPVLLRSGGIYMIKTWKRGPLGSSPLMGPHLPTYLPAYKLAEDVLVKLIWLVICPCILLSCWKLMYEWQIFTHKCGRFGINWLITMRETKAGKASRTIISIFTHNILVRWGM